jgi:hypothetical protein
LAAFSFALVNLAVSLTPPILILANSVHPTTSCNSMTADAAYMQPDNRLEKGALSLA